MGPKVPFFGYFLKVSSRFEREISTGIISLKKEKFGSLFPAKSARVE
jgi:hypothetical protein